MVPAPIPLARAIRRSASVTPEPQGEDIRGICSHPDGPDPQLPDGGSWRTGTQAAVTASLARPGQAELRGAVSSTALLCRQRPPHCHCRPRPDRARSLEHAVWSILTLALALGLPGAPGPGRKNSSTFAGAWQTAWRFNTAIAFVALPSIGSELTGQMAVAIGMAVPVANVMAVCALSRGGSLSLRETAVAKIALNPFLLASVAGVTVGLSGYKIPAPILAPAESAGPCRDPDCASVHRRHHELAGAGAARPVQRLSLPGASGAGARHSSWRSA